jgi:hypothetical protein
MFSYMRRSTRLTTAMSLAAMPAAALRSIGGFRSSVAPPPDPSNLQRGWHCGVRFRISDCAPVEPLEQDQGIVEQIEKFLEGVPLP